MRRAYIGVGLLLVVSFVVGSFTNRTQGQPAAAGVAADANHRKITVTGVGTVKVKPDTARVSFAVKGGGTDFKAAVSGCDKQAEAVKKAIADLKINGLDVKFGPINLVANGDPGFGPGGPPGAPGVPVAPIVEVTRTFTVVATFGGKDSSGELKDIVTVSDKTLAAAVSAGAIELPTFNGNNGGVGFGGGAFCGFGGIGFGGVGGGGNSRVEFYRSNTATLRQDALKLAVADAVSNAKAVAGVANLTAKDIVALSDQVPNGAGLGAAAPPVRGDVLGETELTVQVVVTFNY